MQNCDLCGIWNGRKITKFANFWSQILAFQILVICQFPNVRKFKKFPIFENFQTDRNSIIEKFIKLSFWNCPITKISKFLKFDNLENYRNYKNFQFSELFWVFE